MTRPLRKKSQKPLKRISSLVIKVRSYNEENDFSSLETNETSKEIQKTSLDKQGITEKKTVEKQESTTQLEVAFLGKKEINNTLNNLDKSVNSNPKEPNRNAQLPKKRPKVFDKAQLAEEYVELMESMNKKNRTMDSLKNALDGYTDENSLHDIHQLSVFGVTCTQFFDRASPLFATFLDVSSSFFKPIIGGYPPGGNLELVTLLVIYFFITIYGEIDAKIPTKGSLEITYLDTEQKRIAVKVTTAQFREFIEKAKEKNSLFNVRDMCAGEAPRLTAFAFMLRIPSTYSTKLIRLYGHQCKFTEDEILLLYTFQTSNSWLLKDYRSIYQLLNYDKNLTLSLRNQSTNMLTKYPINNPVN